MSEVDRKPQRGKLPAKKFAVLLYLPLTIPGIIPIYYATKQQDSTVAWVMVATGVGVLLFNALLLAVLYRYFARMRDQG